MEAKSKVIIFVDDNKIPIGEFETPINFDLDTRKLEDGQHHLRIVSKDPTGKEGIRIVPFTVRNGPAVAIEGLKDNEVVDGILPLMINAYGKGNQKSFLIDGVETPKSIPEWMWALILIFLGWAAFYIVTSLG